MSDPLLPLSLRPFARHDADEVLSWFPTEADLRLFAGVVVPWPMSSEALMERTSAEGVRSFTVVTAGDAMAGHVDVVDEGQTSFRLARIAVAPSLRGRGLAVPLVEAALVIAREAGATTVALHVVPGNEPALRAYAHVGFEVGPVNPAHPEYTRLILRL